MLVVMVYLKFGEIPTLTLSAPACKRPVSLCATLSIIQSSPFLKSVRFDFKGKSLRIQWCLKALFANWLHKILIHVIKSVIKL